MKFPEDTIREEIRAEDHSLASIAIVSTAMIFTSLASLTVLF